MRPERTRKFRRTCLDEAPPNGCFDIFGGSSPAGNTTTIQKSDPWSGVQPYLSDIFARAQGLSYGPAVAPQSDATKQALAAQIAGAKNPNGLVSQAQGAIQPYLRGDFLSVDGNPAIQAAVDAARRTVNQQFSGDNYGGSANREWLARAATSAAAPLITDQQNKQLSAIAAAPGLQTANTSILANAGAQQDARAQQELDAPWTQLAKYIQSVSGQPGGSSTSTNPYFTNPAASALGLGLGGLTLYNGLNTAGLLGGGTGALGAAGAGDLLGSMAFLA